MKNTMSGASKSFGHLYMGCPAGGSPVSLNALDSINAAWYNQYL